MFSSQQISPPKLSQCLDPDRCPSILSPLNTKEMTDANCNIEISNPEELLGVTRNIRDIAFEKLVGLYVGRLTKKINALAKVAYFTTLTKLTTVTKAFFLKFSFYPFICRYHGNLINFMKRLCPLFNEKCPTFFQFPKKGKFLAINARNLHHVCYCD